ncbi:MAG TPA: UDP-N-acetylmuramoyl-L-alanyl-D-glutamate--2,6-diaminopimelate ligase [Phycisphaerae bacterium]|nr:UDP-N-acetylmuramoyl-L-alanyl-D-glutamate--2,6-diaminopimelate ligase [Phycisphaerae bacterium]
MDLARLLSEALGKEAVPSDCRGVEVHDLCDDSRKITPGAVFVAMAGTKVRGAAFANEAAARGAAAIVTDADVDLAAGPVIVKVPDSRKALAALAATYFGLDRIQARGELRITGITGTNGKSTTAFMLRSILKSAGLQSALFGTIEYDLIGRTIPAALTTPDAVTLTRHIVEAHDAGARHAVMEVSSHSLCQRRTDGIRFSTAIFTNLTQDHLDYHRTQEDYLLAKRRLFDDLGPEASAVVNADDPSGERIVANCRARIIRFGIDGAAEVRARIIEEGRQGSCFSLEHERDRFEIRTAMVGRHNAVNALGAAAAALALGVPPTAIQEGISSLKNVPGRLQLVDTGDLGFDVYIDYAHTDDALRNVLRAVRPLTRGKLWCVFGCGGDRDQTKRPLMARAVAEAADAFIITSDNPRTEDPLAIIADIERGLSPQDRERSLTEPDRTCAIAYAISHLAPGDILVIAGKGHEKYQILGTEKMHFDDVEVAEGAIRRRARR